MPLFKSGKGQAPQWCEMEYFDIVELPIGATHAYERVGQQEKLIIGKGECRIAFNGQTTRASEEDNLDLSTPDGSFVVLDVFADTTLIRMCGRWGDETGDSGLFTATRSDDPRDSGDPVDYPKETSFDNHYHDCDEYWIVFEGRGLVISEGQSYEVGPGDCIATGMGHHHDFPRIFEPVKGVYLETTLKGQKRRGHLWNHTHGPAEPIAGRV